MRAVAVPPRAGHGDLAQLAGVEVFALGLQIDLAGALLHTHLADPVVDARRLHNPWPFFNRQRQRLFHVDVFAGVQRVDGATAVPVVRRGDKNGIDVLGIEQFAVVVEALRFSRLLLRPVDAVPVDVADRGHVHLIGVHERAHHAGAATAAADKAQLNALIGAHHPGITCRGES